MENAMQNSVQNNLIKGFDIICVSSSDLWEGPWKGRHQIISILSQKNRILFIEQATYSFFTIFRDISRIKRIWSWLIVRKKNRHLYLYTPVLCFPFGDKSYLINKVNNYIIYINLRIIIKFLNFNPSILYLCYFTWGKMAKLYKKTLNIYNAHDVWEVYADNPKLRKYYYALEAETIKNVDLCLFTSEDNLNKKKYLNPNCYYTPQGCPQTPEDLLRSEVPEKPADFPLNNKPIIGYWGTIDKESVDIKLIDVLSNVKKEWTFLFVGPIANCDMKAFEKLKQKKNVIFLGRKPLDQRYNYLCHFDVGILCAQMIEKELLGSQLKIWEYISAGIPVVSIPVKEYINFGDMVLIASDINEWIKNISEAMKYDNKKRIESRIKLAKANTWDKRVMDIIALINKTLYSKRA